MSIKVDNELQQIEREAAFGALLNEGLLEYYNALSDPCFNEEIPQFWNAWISTRNLLFISKIVRHNCCCLAKEYYLKQKRMDKLEPRKIQLLSCSAQLEKNFIRQQLGLNFQ